MIGKKLIAATVAGAAFGAGTFALAPSMAASGSSSDSAQHQGKAQHKGRKAIARHKNMIHGSWVTKDKVQHEAIRGVVRAVDGDSITVQALDGVSQTYSVTSDTKVRKLGDDHKGLDAISDVKVGDKALVAGVGDNQAKHVIARTPKASSSSTS